LVHELRHFFDLTFRAVNLFSHPEVGSGRKMSNEGRMREMGEKLNSVETPEQNWRRHLKETMISGQVNDFGMSLTKFGQIGANTT
jgi:hypothetical protein